jgi:hypothetical protein
MPKNTALLSPFTFWIICLILFKMYSDETKRKLENIIRGSLIEGIRIIAQQSATSYVQALAQVQRLKETSKVNSSLKKNRSQA